MKEAPNPYGFGAFAKLQEKKDFTKMEKVLCEVEREIRRDV